MIKLLFILLLVTISLSPKAKEENYLYTREMVNVNFLEPFSPYSKILNDLINNTALDKQMVLPRRRGIASFIKEKNSCFFPYSSFLKIMLIQQTI